METDCQSRLPGESVFKVQLDVQLGKKGLSYHGNIPPKLDMKKINLLLCHKFPVLIPGGQRSEIYKCKA